MADQKALPLSLATDPSRINPTGASPEDLSEYQKSLDSQIKALEQRYANPNYFKVAAGFLKPQLGGFFASLGSASEAMGENVEQQRAAELPIAQMRSQLAQSKILTGQNKTQSDEFEAWRLSKKPMDEATYARIVSLQPDSAVAKAAKGFFDAAQTSAGTTQTRLQTEIDALKAAGGDPRMTALADIYSPTVTPEKRKAAEDFIFNSRPPQIEAEAWAAMAPYDRAEELRSYSRAQRESGMDKEKLSAEQAKSAMDRLPLLHSIRETAVQPGMDKFLGVFKGNDLLSIIGRAATEGKIAGGKLQGFDEYYKQANLTNDQIATAQNLVKQLAELQVRSGQTITNPTDLARELYSMATPGTGNTQRSLLTLVDALAYSDKHAKDRHAYIIEGKIPSRKLESNTTLDRMEREYMENKSKLLTSDPFQRPADWIYKTSSLGDYFNQKPTAAPATSAAPTAPASPVAQPAGAQPPAGSTWAQLQAWKQSQAQKP
jgi:hypothetical protein